MTAVEKESSRCLDNTHQLLIPNQTRKKVNGVNFDFMLTLNEKSMPSAQTGSGKNNMPSGHSDKIYIL